MRERRASSVLARGIEERSLQDVARALHEEIARADDVGKRARPFLELHAAWWGERVDREWCGIASNSAYDEVFRGVEEAPVVALEVEDHERDICGTELHKEVEQER